jgi:hypothetical protein
MGDGIRASKLALKFDVGLPNWSLTPLPTPE